LNRRVVENPSDRYFQVHRQKPLYSMEMLSVPEVTVVELNLYFKQIERVLISLIKFYG